MELLPDEATFRRDSEEEIVSADEIAADETIIVRPCERIPAMEPLSRVAALLTSLRSPGE
jgi:hypothetical protein